MVASWMIELILIKISKFKNLIIPFTVIMFNGLEIASQPLKVLQLMNSCLI